MINDSVTASIYHSIDIQSMFSFWLLVEVLPPEHPKLLKTFHSFVSYFPLLIHNEQQCEEKCKFFMAKTDSRDGFESSNKARFSLADGLKLAAIKKFSRNEATEG